MCVAELAIVSGKGEEATRDERRRAVRGSCFDVDAMYDSMPVEKARAVLGSLERRTWEEGGP